jgi:hypothetical protein
MVFLALPLALASWLLSSRAIRRNAQEIGFLAYWCMTIFSATAMLGIHLARGGAIVHEGRNLLVRLLFSGTENLVFFLAFFSLFRLLSTLNQNTILSLALLLFLGLTLIAGIEIINKESLQVFHSNGSAALRESRLSLLMSEPSQAFPTYAALFFTVILFIGDRNPWLTTGLTILFLMVALKIDSKGGLPILAISIAVPLIPLLRNRPQLGRYVGGGIIIVISIIVISLVSKGSEQFQDNIEKWSSFGTRLVGFCSAGLTLFTYPFGVGYGTFHVHYPGIISKTANWLQYNSGIPFNLEEVYFMAGTGETLSAKAGIPTQIVYNGILAIWFFCRTFSRAWRQTYAARDPLYKFIGQAFVVFIFCTLCFGADMNTLYAWLIPIALMELPSHQKGALSAIRREHASETL